MSEILAEFTRGLPAEWTVEPIERLCSSCRSGGTPSRGEKEYWNDGTIPFAMIEDLTGCGLYLLDTRRRITAAGIEASSAWIVPAGAVLVSMYATVGETAINTVPMATNQAILALRVLPEHSAEYIAYCISYFRGLLLRRRVESTQKNINKGILTTFDIPVPSLDEQQKIAAVLVAVQRAIERQERLIALTGELKKAVMRKLFTEGTRGEPLKPTDFGFLPHSWKVLTLNDLKSVSEKRAIVSGPFGSNIGKRFFVERGVPLIRGCNLTKGERFFVEEGFVFITEKKANELSGCVAVEGDLIFTAAGTLGQVGLIVPTSRFPRYVISNKQLRARLDNARVRPQFVFHWFASDTIQTLIEQRRGGASIPVINLSLLKALPVPLPSLKEQDQIIELLAAVQAKRGQHERQAQSLSDLFRNLLHSLMTAQIRVHDLDVSALEEAEREPVEAV